MQNIELDPNDTRHYIYYAENCMRMKKYDQAAELLSRADNIQNLNPEVIFGNISLYKALLYAVKKDKLKALETYPKASGWLYALLKMNDESIAFISNKSIKRSATFYWDLVNNPFYEGLREDPAFQEVLQREQTKHQNFLDVYRGL
jgi:tetratricopeptide (TPR) repeat protein